ncbi:MAG: hypothetical protein JMDDDDMK_05267 [Acidobacteria bacterium]|nr:hypothetical protein [Acidobacteriota bacterium]
MTLVKVALVVLTTSCDSPLMTTASLTWPISNATFNFAGVATSTITPCATDRLKPEASIVTVN